MRNFFITSVAFFLSGVWAVAQVNLPIDPETNLVTYEDVTDEQGTATELFDRAIDWFNDYYPNPRSVIQEKDLDKMKVTGKHKFRIQLPDKKGVMTHAGYIKYTIKIWTKDNLYRYKLSDFNLEYITYSPIEIWLDESHPEFETNQRKLAAIDSYVKDLIDNLSSAMIAPDAPVDEDDW